MICHECKSLGLKSKVYPGVTTSTIMPVQPYYDECGKLHNHDKNISTTSFNCSNGHRWWIDSPTAICHCGWPEN